MKPKVCIKCQWTFSRISAILITESEREVHTMTTYEKNYKARLVEKFYNCPNYQNREYIERYYWGFMKNKA